MTSERSFISSAREPSQTSASASAKTKNRSRTKNTKSVVPIKERNEGRLLPSNFKAFKWKNLTELNVEDCKNDITAEMIQKCDKTLDYLEFTGLTNFRNVKLLIRTCTNIQSLNFTDIVLNNYGPDYNIVDDDDEPDQDIDRNFRDRDRDRDRRRDSENGNQIITKLRALRKLTFYGLGSLSVHELHIFDFLYESIRFDRLKSLYFISQKSDYWNTSSANIFKSNLDATVLSRFLNKNWAVLKSLKVNRTDLILYDDSNRRSPKIVNIQLVKLECDMSGKGFKKLLENQTELQVLNIYNKNLTLIDLDDILESLRRCSETIKDVRIHYNVKHRENPIDFQENEDPRILNHDCRMYKYCRKLKKLHICVSRVHKPEFPESFKIRPGGIINVHLIPTTIKYLTIQFDEIHKKDMKSFAAVFSTFENLKYFIFEGNNEDRPYRLKIPWILTVADLPKIQYFKFTSCRIEDLAAIEVITQSLPSLFLEVSDTTCAYYRSQKIKSKFK